MMTPATQFQQSNRIWWTGKRHFAVSQPVSQENVHQFRKFPSKETVFLRFEYFEVQPTVGQHCTFAVFGTMHV